MAKPVHITRIFATMEYGDVTDNTKAAELWLKKVKQISCDASFGHTVEVKGINNEVLLKLVSPLAKDLNNIVNTMIPNKWWIKPRMEKALLIDRFAAEIEKNSALICELEILVRGILGNDTRTKGLPLLVELLHYYSSCAVTFQNEYQDEEEIAVSVIADDVFLPVFGSILGPALSAGYNIILQTEPKISILAALLIQLAENVGISKGVIKLLPGTVDLSSLFKYENITVISCHGNLYADKFNDVEYPTKKKMIAVSKGKAPMIVFNNADLDSASDAVIDAAWGYRAFLPWSLNTLIVQEDVFKPFVDKLKSRLASVRVGEAFDKLADVVHPTKETLHKLTETVAKAKALGIEVVQHQALTLLIGGKVLVNSVIGADRDTSVVAVVAFRNTDEAASLANNTRHGVGASLWTENIGLANEVAQKLHFGNIWINSFGKFSAFASYTPYKDSGVGYINGPEGKYEYLKVKNDPDVSAELDKKVEIQSYAVEVDGIFSKNLAAAVAAAKKGYDVWKNVSLTTRSLFLRKVALEFNNSKKTLSLNTGICETTFECWIELTYQALSEAANAGHVHQNKSEELKTLRESVGVIVMDESTYFRDNFLCIIGSIILGNSVLVLNFNTDYLRFYLEVCKLLAILKFPSGVFNVVVNSSNEIIENVMRYKELNTYFAFEQFPLTIKIRNLKRVYLHVKTWSDVLHHATKIKNVWCNISDSVL